LIVLLSLFSTLVIFLSGLYLGFTNSVSKSLTDISGKMIFLIGYFIEIFSYLSFCLLLSIIFKKTGITFIVHFVYYIIEPILDFKLNDKITPFLPINAINGIIRSPNTSLIKIKSPDFNYDFQEVISFTDVSICLGFTSLFILLSYLILKKRDL
jgi:ABC-2 type transport system permease protein